VTVTSTSTPFNGATVGQIMSATAVIPAGTVLVGGGASIQNSDGTPATGASLVTTIPTTVDDATTPNAWLAQAVINVAGDYIIVAYCLSTATA
jgi:hypothetical protein